MLQKRKKHPLTLIEVLLCVGLIVLAGSLFAVKGKQLWQRHQYFSAVDRLCDELILTRHFSQSLRADVDLFLIKKGDGVRLVRQFDEPGMLRMKHSFPQIIDFKNIYINSDQNLFFYGNGWHDFDEELRINGVEQTIISLKPESFCIKKFVK